MLINLFRFGYTFEEAIINLLVIALMIFLILPVHEFAHAGVALLLGDKSIKHRGRLSLNPLVHIDPFGALMMLLVGFGWAKPVAVNPSYFKKPKLYMALTALAGPVSNILCAMLGGGLIVLINEVNKNFSLGKIGYYLFVFLLYYISINISLAVFNLIPVPPLDGSKVLFLFLDRKAEEFFYRYGNYVFLGFILIMYSGALDKPRAIITEFLIEICTFGYLP